MSTFKKALSLVLCFAMLTGIFGVAATSIAPLASAADNTAGVSNIDSYASLEAAYDNFIYLGLEFWEYDAEKKVTLTDHYVDAGQILQMRVFLKSDRYIGSGTVGFVFDEAFFDLKKGGAAYPQNIAETVPLYDGVTTGVNPNNQAVADEGINFTRTSGLNSASIPAVKSGYITLPARTLNCNVDTGSEMSCTTTPSDDGMTQFAVLKDTTIGTGVYVWEAKDDAWMLADDVYVKSDLADGTVGYVYAEPMLYKSYDYNEVLSKGSRPWDVKSSDDSTVRAASAPSLTTRKGTVVTVNVENFLTDDTYHAFQIGSAVTYTATFSYENGGATLTKEVKNLAAGATVSVPTDIVHDKEGYTFKGWTTVKDDPSDLTATPKMSNKDTTFYAYYTANPTFDVKYVDENGNTYGEIERYEEGETYTIATTAPEKTGYKFDGWSTVEGDKSAIVTGEQTMGTEAVTLYPVYTVSQFSVSFITNANDVKFSNGTNTLKITKDYGASIDVSEIESLPERAGFEFVGWAAASDATEGLTEGEIIKVPANNASKFYAIWKAVPFKVTVYASEADYNAGVVLEEQDKVANERLVVANAITVPEGQKLLGWVDADAPKNGEEWNIISKNANFGAQYKLGKDASIYPVFVDYAYSIEYKVWDYVNEEWTTLGDVQYTDTAIVTRKQLNDVRKSINAETDLGLPGCEVDHPWASSSALTNLYLGMDMTGEGCVAETDLGTGKDTASSAAIYDLATDDDGEVVIYIYTIVKFNITNTTAEFDENGKYVGETETTETYIPLNTDANKKEFTRIIDKATLVCPDPNYKFIGFTNADGETITPVAESDTTYTLAFNTEDGSNVVINSVFGPRTYTIQFAVGNGDTIVATTPVLLGGTIDLTKLEYTYSAPEDKAGQPATLPVVGKAGEEQDPPVNGKEGYEFKGWNFTRLEDAPGTFPVEVTEELLADVLYADANDDIIRIKAIWEAKTYTATFKYQKADGTDAEPITREAKVGAALSTFAPLDDETVKLLNENAPEGYVFARWAAEDGSNSTEMTPGGRTYVAVYVLKTYRVYVDYNNGKTNEDGSIALKDANSATYGEDIEFGDADYQAAGFTIRNESFGRTNANLPSEDSVHMGWKVFYVEDPADVTNKDKWVEGYNNLGDGSTKVYTTIIYQAQWKTYSDFFFTVNDTDGKLFFALGKDFSLNYWNNDIACSKDKAVLNPNPDNIILLFTIDFSQGLTFTPLAVNASLFTFEGIIGLFKALGNAIGGLIGDLFE